MNEVGLTQSLAILFVSFLKLVVTWLWLHHS